VLSIVCPVYNEAKNVGPLFEALARDVKVPAELVIVYDFEEDTTLPVVARLVEGFPMKVRICRNRYGRGVLNAVKSGLEETQGSTSVAVIMADLSDDLPALNRMYELIENGTYDVVCASRYMKGGRQIGGPVLKKFLSRAAGLSLHRLAGVPTRDATNNFKMYRGSFLEQTPIESVGGFEIGLELVAKAHVNGYRIGEVPATWTDRVAGESRFRLAKWLPHYVKWYLHAFKRPAAGRTNE